MQGRELAIVDVPTKMTSAAGSRSEWKHGWPAVAAYMTGTIAGLPLYSITHGFFVKSLAAEFGWGRGQIATMSGIVLVTALTIPFAGMFADSRGVRSLAIIGSAAFTACYFAFASMTGALWQFFTILAAIALVGGSCTNYFVLARPIAAAFDHARGFALSIGLCGVPTFSFVFLPVLQHIIAVDGWRAGFLAMAMVSLVFGPITFILLGRVRAASGGAATTPAQTEFGATTGTTGLSLQECLRDSRFWLLALAMIGANLPIGFYFSSLQPMLSDKGVDGHTAALLGSWYAIAAVAGRLSVGRMLDRLWPPLVAVLTLGAPAMALVTFYLASGSQVLLLGFGVALYALAMGAEVDVLCFLILRYFGLRTFGLLSGLLGAITAIFASIGGMASGFIYDRLGSYDPAMLGGAAMSFVAACAVLASGLVRQRLQPPAVNGGLKARHSEDGTRI